MKVSARTNYACLAMLELASQYGGDRPIRIREIAALHGASPQFLVQILLQLKRSGLVASTRGAAGGYQINRPPEEVSLGEVMAAITGSADKDESVGSSAQPSTAADVLMQTWRELAAIEQERLRGISLADLLDRIRGHGGPMYHI